VKKLIFGYGVTGKTVEQYFQKSNINYLIYDENKELNLPTELVFEPSRFSEIDEVIISPGVKPSNSLLEQFYLIEKPVITDIDIFNNIYKEKIIGITGTNGKTTFVNLLTGFLNSQGSESIAVGNVGKSPLEIIDKKFDYVVMELSSFQLHYINKLDLFMGVILNIYEDHLDWHRDFDEYANSKRRIKEFITEENVITNFLDGNDINNLDKEFDLSKLPFYKNTSEMFLKVIENLNFNKNTGYEYLLNSKTDEHRYEIVDEFNDVLFINDSKSTNFNSVSMATQNINNGILIMHGLTKNITTKDLKIYDGVKTILIPKDMDVNFGNLDIEIIRLDSIFNLKDVLLKIINPGDTVLFSCGGASFNDFENYEERGRFFKDIVLNIKKEING
tara:strand:- start:277 stop:1443 length:1167 start_codon:yes stop_codon:yes gene_type:complete